MAMNKSVIVSGEAPETDSEEETSSTTDSHHKTIGSIQGAVITGEDSESENEIGSGISSAVSVLSPISPDGPQANEKYFDSLLHKKLKECNTNLHKHLDNFAQNMVNESTRDLSAMNQQLLKSQLTLQAAVSSLRTLNVSSTKIKNKFHDVISSSFIPNISVDK